MAFARSARPSASGRIASINFRDGVAVRQGSLLIELDAATQADKDRRIFVRADQSTAYMNVVNVMSQLSAEGFVKVGIFAETASEG